MWQDATRLTQVHDPVLWHGMACLGQMIYNVDACVRSMHSVVLWSDTLCRPGLWITAQYTSCFMIYCMIAEDGMHAYWLNTPKPPEERHLEWAKSNMVNQRTLFCKQRQENTRQDLRRDELCCRVQYARRMGMKTCVRLDVGSLLFQKLLEACEQGACWLPMCDVLCDRVAISLLFGRPSFCWFRGMLGL